MLVKLDHNFQVLLSSDFRNEVKKSTESLQREISKVLEFP